MNESEGEKIINIKPNVKNTLNNWYELLVDIDYIDLIKWYISTK